MSSDATVMKRLGVVIVNNITTKNKAWGYLTKCGVLMPT
jgi:hypothetical protein